MTSPLDTGDISARITADTWNDIAGVYEVSQDLNVPHSRIRGWIERRASTGCPKPVRELRQGKVYSLREWRAWFKVWRLTRGAETWWCETGTPKTGESL